MIPKKRFIAGAICKQCQLQDTIALFTSATDEWIACVECGYTERRPTAEDIQHQVASEESQKTSIAAVKFYGGIKP